MQGGSSSAEYSTYAEDVAELEAQHRRVDVSSLKARPLCFLLSDWHVRLLSPDICMIRMWWVLQELDELNAKRIEEFEAERKKRAEREVKKRKESSKHKDMVLQRLLQSRKKSKTADTG